MNTPTAVPFLRIALATSLVVARVLLPPRNSHIPWVVDWALVFVNAALIVPKGSRRWFFLSLYYLGAGCVLWARLASR